jgi:hypothetical protein
VCVAARCSIPTPSAGAQTDPTGTAPPVAAGDSTSRNPSWASFLRQWRHDEAAFKIDVADRSRRDVKQKACASSLSIGVHCASTPVRSITARAHVLPAPSYLAG